MHDDLYSYAQRTGMATIVGTSAMRFTAAKRRKKWDAFSYSYAKIGCRYYIYVEG